MSKIPFLSGKMISKIIQSYSLFLMSINASSKSSAVSTLKLFDERNFLKYFRTLIWFSNIYPFVIKHSISEPANPAMR